MKVAVVENERREVEGAFDYANFKYFHSAIQYKYFETSQSFIKDNDFASYAVIFVDLDLSRQSDSDGYGLIKELLKVDDDLKSKIIILTGQHRIEEKLTENNLPKFPIILKPANFKIIYDQFKQMGFTH